MPFDKISVPSVREAFVSTIEDKILSGELKVGDRLPPARQLCQDMGVSLTIINAGIAELAAKGFVTVKPRHGTYVADYRMQGTTETMVAMMRFNGGDLNERDARSFWESRTAVDPLIVDSLMRRASDDQIRQLTPILEQMRQEKDISRICVLITEFFQKIYELSDNSLMYLLYHSTVIPQRRLYALYIQHLGLKKTMDHLETIHDSIVHRQPEKAKKEMLEMIRPVLEGPDAIYKE